MPSARARDWRGSGDLHSGASLGSPPTISTPSDYLARRIFSRTIRFFSSTNTSFGAKFSSSLSS